MVGGVKAVGSSSSNVSAVDLVRSASAVATNVYITKTREKFWSLKSGLTSTCHLLKPMLTFNSYVRGLEAHLRQVESDLIKLGASKIPDGSAAIGKTDDALQGSTTLSPVTLPASRGETPGASHDFEAPLVEPFEEITLSDAKGPDQMSTDSDTAAITLNAAVTAEDISNIPMDATETVYDQTYRGEQSSFKSVYQSLRNRYSVYFRPSVQAGYRRLEWTCVSIRPINTRYIIFRHKKIS